MAERSTPFDVIETYTSGKDGPPKLSMYAEIGRACQWKVKENRHGNPSLELVRWTRMTEETRARFATLKAERRNHASARTPKNDVLVQKIRARLVAGTGKMAFTYLAERTVIYWSEDWLKLSKEGWITYHVEQVEPGVTLAVMVLRDGPRQQLLLPPLASMESSR